MAFPTYPAISLPQAIELTIFSSNQLHEVVNGDATTEIAAEDGPIPSIRKALAESFYFLDPIAWSNGSDETVFNQLRDFSGTWYYAPTATVTSPIPMGSTPVGDSNWKLWSGAAVTRLESTGSTVEEVASFFSKLTGTLNANHISALTIRTDKVNGDPTETDLPDDEKVYLKNFPSISISGGINWHISGDYEITLDTTPSGGETFTVKQNSDDKINVSGMIVGVEYFGVVHNDRASAASNTTALQYAIDYCAKTKQTLDLGFGSIFLDGGILLTEHVHLKGRGTAFWHWVPGAASVVAPTQLVFVGTGSKSHTLHGISSMEASGAVVPNADNRSGTHNDTEYRMPSFMNSSSGQAGRSKRAFSVGIHIVGGDVSHSVLEDFRMFTDYGGDDGLDGFTANTSITDPFAANWDIGIWHDGGLGVVLNNVQVVGHWRMYGRLVTGARNGDKSFYDTYGYENPYWCKAYNCLFEGYVAEGIRGSDSHKIVAITTSTVEIVWADDHPYGTGLNDYGDLVSLGTHFFATTDFTVSNYEKVNVGGQDRLRMTLTSDPIAAGYDVGDTVHPADFGSGGTSHVHDVDCDVRSLQHPSNVACTNLSLSEVFDAPSFLFNLSGHRAVEYINTRGQFRGRDEGGLFIHEFWTIVFRDSQWERNNFSDETSPDLAETPFRVIAAPWHEDSIVVPNTQSAGWTRQILLDSQAAIFTRDLDLRPMYALDRYGRFPSGGFFNPDLGTVTDLAYDFGGSQGNAIRAPVDKRVGFRDSTYWDTSDANNRALGWKFYYEDSLDEVVSASSLYPQNNNVQVSGENGRAWAEMWTFELQGPNAAGLALGTDGVQRWVIDNTHLGPRVSEDGLYSLGNAGGRCSEIFAVTGTINTSDQNDKQQIRDLSEVEKNVATSLKGMIKAFKFNDAVAKKGDAARTHIGVIAQEVKAVFESEGLVAEDYGILCYDEWLDEEGNTQSRYGVRYEELLAFIISVI